MQKIQSAFFWLIELTKKYSGLVALFGFCTGLFSLWQVERREEFAQFFGGTSLLILVGVVLDTLQQIESHLLMRHYDGLMKTGRIKGRTPVQAGGPVM